MKFKVYYTAYDNHEWRHENGEEVVEANSAEEAREIIESRSSMMTAEYIVSTVVEVKE